jgi:hypothetical protein
MSIRWGLSFWAEQAASNAVEAIRVITFITVLIPKVYGLSLNLPASVDLYMRDYCISRLRKSNLRLVIRPRARQAKNPASSATLQISLPPRLDQNRH